MDPHPYDMDGLGALLHVCYAEALEDLRDVTQVEGVMRLAWNRLQWTRKDIFVDVE
jgi:hypothetical protein